MTGTLSFELPVERWEFDTAVHAENWQAVASALELELRGALKYDAWHGRDAAPETVVEAMEWVRSRMFAHLNERGLRLE